MSCLILHWIVKKKGVLSYEKKVIFDYETLPKFYFEVILDEEDSVEEFAKVNQIHIICVEEIEE